MIKKVKIGNKWVGDSQPVYIEVDLGAKYYSLPVIKKMIKTAADAGADAVKLQTYTSDNITRDKGKFYRGKNRPGENQYSFFKKYQLSKTDHVKLFRFAQKTGITIFSTPCHKDDVDFLETLNPPVYKISSGDCTNLPFLEYVASKRRPIILSTGMATFSEVCEAVETIFSTGNRQLILLHCTVDYPTEVSDANLQIVDTLKTAFSCPVGLSDHTTGTMVSFLAAAKGANYIEKHFCLDRDAHGPDSEPALEPKELEQLVSNIRNIPLALGQSNKRILKSERKWRRVARKSITAAIAIPKGAIITREMLTVTRPADGLHPKYWKVVLNRKARKAISAGTAIKWNMI